MNTQFFRILVTALCTLFTAAAFADPPARVGRVSYLSGTVLFHSDAESEWVPTTLNYPVTSNNSFWAEAGARSEIRVGSTAIRLDHDTQLDVVTLDDDNMLLNVPQGSVNLRLRGVYKDDRYEIQVPPRDHFAALRWPLPHRC